MRGKFQFHANKVDLAERVRWEWSKHLLVCTECRYNLSPSRSALCRDGERLWMAYQSLKAARRDGLKR